jgi:hypothetical protein
MIAVLYNQTLMDKIMGVLVPEETLPSKIKGSKMPKNMVSMENAATVIDDIYRFLFPSSSF